MNRKTVYSYNALASKVLAVAVLSYEIVPNENSKTATAGEESLYDWAVYIDAVPGINHNQEYMNVAQKGDKCPKQIATILFPSFDTEKYRR